jgi:hypothetical protein
LDAAKTPGGKKPPNGNWVMLIELGNELGNESACGKGLIFATGAPNHSLTQTFDRKGISQEMENL